MHIRFASSVLPYWFVYWYLWCIYLQCKTLILEKLCANMNIIITDDEARRNEKCRDLDIKIVMRELSERTGRNNTARQTFKLLICKSYGGILLKVLSSQSLISSWLSDLILMLPPVADWTVHRSAFSLLELCHLQPFNSFFLSVTCTEALGQKHMMEASKHA